MEENMNVVTDVAEVAEVAAENGSVKKIAIGAGAALVVSGIAYGAYRLGKKLIGTIRNRNAVSGSAEESVGDQEFDEMFDIDVDES